MFKEKVKYTVTTGHCNFCESGAQRGTLKESKEKEVWSWAGNICFYHRGIFEISNVFSCHWLEQRLNSLIFFFLILESDKLMRVKYYVYSICIFVCVCACTYICTTLLSWLQDHDTTAGSQTQSCATNLRKEGAGWRGRDACRGNRML